MEKAGCAALRANVKPLGNHEVHEASLAAGGDEDSRLGGAGGVAGGVGGEGGDDGGGAGGVLSVILIVTGRGGDG